MITLINGTNRKNNKTDVFAVQFYKILQSQTEETVRYLSLDAIAHDWFFPEMYKMEHQASSITKIQDEYILAAQKFFIISPEYNGGLPGALKLFIDAISVRQYKHNFKGKKAALVGIATGRAGNLRGMDQLADILNHMGTILMPQRMPISRIDELLSDEQEIVDEAILQSMKNFAKDFIAF
ncbi:MAG: NAD(P)H-dependent oxidoreductase [Saprospiraceae bacterium]|nr:NAD(P)H-dependent oxidoreductase [Saprospiraceae bacterium]